MARSPPPPQEWESSFSNPLRQQKQIGMASKADIRAASTRNVINRPAQPFRRMPGRVRRSHSAATMEKSMHDEDEVSDAREGIVRATFKPQAPKSAPPPLPPSSPPALPTPPPIPTSPSSVEEQIKSMYEKYNPEMIKALDGVLKRFKGREDALLKSLKKKYEGVEAVGSSESTGSSKDTVQSTDDVGVVTGESLGVKVQGDTKEARNAEFFAQMKKKKEEEEKEKARKEQERLQLMTPEERAEFDAEREKEANRQKLQGRMLDVQMRQYGIQKWKKPSSRSITGNAKASKRALALGGRGRGRGKRRGRGRGRK